MSLLLESPTKVGYINNLKQQRPQGGHCLSTPPGKRAGGAPLQTTRGARVGYYDSLVLYPLRIYAERRSRNVAESLEVEPA